MPLTFITSEGRFTYRVAGIALQDEHVLLCSDETIDFWFLPGGRPEFGETLHDALKREMLEELNAEVEVGQLALVVENFFDDKHGKHHGVGFYFLMTLPETLMNIEEVHRGLEHDSDAVTDAGKEDGRLELSFRWFPLGDLESLDVRPKCLSEVLANLSKTTRHLVNFG